jgi:hypothetical protein
VGKLVVLDGAPDCRRYRGELVVGEVNCRHGPDIIGRDLSSKERVDKVTVAQLINAAFRLSSSRCQELHRTWISISFKAGGLLPESLLLASVQRSGELDMVLRCMEDDFSPEASMREVSIFHYQAMFSEIWIGEVYEIFRLLGARKVAPDSDAFRALAHDLRLLRIPLEKHEIALHGKLPEPLTMLRQPPGKGEADVYMYSSKDPQRAHIMPSGLSSRGSVRWQAIDPQSMTAKWLERRALSDRIVALWEPSASIR